MHAAGEDTLIKSVMVALVAVGDWGFNMSDNNDEEKIDPQPLIEEGQRAMDELGIVIPPPADED